MYKIILILIIAVVAALMLRCRAVRGGMREVVITNLMELPAMITYTDDITGQTEQYNTRRDRYMDPASDRQIATIAGSSVADYSRLVQLVGKFYRGRNADIPRLLGKRDSELYRELRERFPRENVDSSKRDQNHAECNWRVIAPHYKKPKKGAKLLDIGCNRGASTAVLAQLAGAEAYGVDVIDASSPDINYTKIEGSQLPFKDKTFDIVTADMTLHHIKDVDEMLAEIRRVLKPGGILYIKEHDCWTAADAMLIDVEHLMYDRVGGDEGEYKLYHYTNYHGWHARVAAKKLRYVAGDYFYLNVRNEMSATRAYWSIYH